MVVSGVDQLKSLTITKVAHWEVYMVTSSSAPVNHCNDDSGHDFFYCFFSPSSLICVANESY